VSAADLRRASFSDARGARIQPISATDQTFGVDAMSSTADRQIYATVAPSDHRVSQPNLHIWIAAAVLVGLAVLASAVPPSVYAQAFPPEMPFVGP
jgi:hypothetical protein